jgi:hypothetical protein
LNTLTGVLEAHVHVNLPEHDPLLGRKRDVGGTGSVLLVIDDRFGVKDEEISALVAGAAGVPAGSVTVLRSLAARDPALVPTSLEIPIVQPAPSSEVESKLRMPDLVRWVSPEAACGVMASFACGAAGFAAVRRRRRKRTRFSLPVELEHES